MSPLVIVLAAATMLVLAVLMSWVLGWANRAFHVEVNPLVEQAIDALPGANCGGCGYVGCEAYAKAVVEEGEDVSLCPVGGESVADDLAAIMGIERGESLPYRPVVHCGATTDQRLGWHEYRGHRTCASANLVADVQGCAYGCLGFGDCVRACPFDAIHVVDGLATVDYDKCVGCGKCEKACPRHIISLVPFKASEMLVIKCSNQDFGKDVKAVCKVGCIGCKACSRVGENIEMVDNLPRIDYESYDPEKMDLDVIIEKCPMKRMVKLGNPTEKDRRKVADEDAPPIVTADFKTTVDETEWRG